MTPKTLIKAAEGEAVNCNALLGGESVAFWKQWIDLQLRHNIDQILAFSIKDFHFKGLNYICFQFTPTLTVRLYITHPQESVDTENISIHNHLYDSQILVLSGWIRNRAPHNS